MIANTVLDWIYNQQCFRLTSWHQPFLTPACLQEYAGAITRQGSPLTNCFGFIDGTVCPICHPREKQRIVYKGHKHVRALKFQSDDDDGLSIIHTGEISGVKREKSKYAKNGKYIITRWTKESRK